VAAAAAGCGCEPVVVWASSCRGTGTGQPHHSDLQLARTALCIRYVCGFTCTSRLFAMPCVSIACCKVARLCLSTPTRRVASHPLCRPGSDCVTHWLDRVSAACCRKKPGEANAMACHTSYHGRHAAPSQSCGSRAKCELSQSDMIGVWRCACCLPACPVGGGFASAANGFLWATDISRLPPKCQISDGLAAVTRCSLLTRTP
jgi:hypothetical protein